MAGDVNLKQLYEQIHNIRLDDYHQPSTLALEKALRTAETRRKSIEAYIQSLGCTVAASVFDPPPYRYPTLIEDDYYGVGEATTPNTTNDDPIVEPTISTAVAIHHRSCALRAGGSECTC
jgi:hypothetical protein